MAVSPTSPPRYRPKRGRGRFYFFLFLFGLIFAGGFYTGARVTRHVAKSGPDWLRSRFGVQDGWLPAQTAAPVVAPAPVAAQKAAAPVGAAPVVPGAPTTGAVAASPAPNAPNTLPESRPVAPGNIAAAGTSEALDQNVAEYNATLRRAENSFHDYMIASQVLTAPNAAEDRDAASDHAHTAADDLQAYVHRAQSLYDTVHADPLYPKKYKETDRALDPTAVRAQFQEMTVDNLRYIRPKQ